MSEVEQLFVKLQQAVGGNVSWYQLNPMQQQDFVNAVNTILNYCAVQN